MLPHKRLPAAKQHWHHYFLTTVTGAQIGGAQVAPQQAAHVALGFVAAAVAVLVVDLFEMASVHHQQRHLLAGALTQIELFGEDFFKPGAVV